MPYKDSSEYESIARRRKIAQAMQEKSMAPYTTQMVSGRAVPYNIGDALGTLGSAYFSKKGADAASEEEANLKSDWDTGKSKTVADAISKYQGQKQEVGTGRGPLIDIPADPMGAVGDISGSKYSGDLKSIQDAMLKQQLGGEGSSFYTNTPGEKGAMVFNARTGQMEYQNYPEGYTPMKADVDLAGRLSGSKEGAKQVVLDEHLPARTEKIKDIESKAEIATHEAKSDIDVLDNPLEARMTERAKLEEQRKAKPDIEAAVQTAKDKAKRTFGMEGVNKLASRAKEILSGGTGALPTGSTVGAAVDYLGGLVGYSPDGAREAASLKAISGALAGKMPRFEGPQSDYDREYYMDMAARVGDSSVPIDQRLSALEEVVDIWGQYEDTSPAGEGAEPDIDETGSFMRDLDKSLGLGGN